MFTLCITCHMNKLRVRMANILNKMGGQRLKQRLQEMEIYFENKFIIGPQKLQQIWTPKVIFFLFSKA